MGGPILELSPDKRFFKIGEAAKIAGIKPFVLRFWESEFKDIRPHRSLSGQRVYSREDLDLILKIKDLLYEQKFTIPGAKAFLKEEKLLKQTGGQPPISLGQIRRELEAILEMLK